ncbi:SURF1 family protein [Isoptericola halotolerans]|uniref:SURF1-like protein n=1 Tax=Isoptericola halotolerans TaxID=300560 RepID=A0ABX2A0X9_9MICO|nr:cytochrome oxidase assembly protein ShyY1 [Isoptericola halotolerans]
MPDAPPARRSFRAVARQPRMITILLIFLAAAAVCGRLGVWQIDRAYERANLAAEQEAAEAAVAAPVAIGELLAPQASFPGELVGREVAVTGTYEPDGQLLVAGRALDGADGYLVLTPLRVSDDGTGGASWASLSGEPVLPVVRGWVDSSTPDPAALEVPPGEVALHGWLQASESTARSGVVPDNPGGPPLTQDIASSALANTWQGPIYTGYVVLTDSAPLQTTAAEGGPAPLPRPVLEGGADVNLQNFFYALQWWVFGLFAVALWVRLVRDEMAGGVRERRSSRDRGGRDADPVGTGIAGLPSS